MVLGQLAGLVEVAEPSEGLEGALVVVGEVEAVELLQCLPAGFEAGVGVEEGVESRRTWVSPGEPSDDVEAVQHVAGVPEVGVDGGLVGLGAV